jgi:hypothetical protein
MFLFRRALLLLLTATASLAEYREFNGLIEADSTYIHYSEGYIVAPGFIDLKHLTFTTVADDEVVAPYEDGEEREPTHDEEKDAEENDDTTTDTPGDEHGGGRRELTDIANGNTVDIVFFNEVRAVIP